MPEPEAVAPSANELALEKEVARLNKIILALMDRAERSASAQYSEYGQFQTTVLLEDQIRLRTAELTAALAEIEKANRALSFSEARFRGVVSQSIVGIAIVEDGKFSYTNAKFNQIFGYTADEIRQIAPADTVSVEDRAAVAESIRHRLTGELNEADYGFRGLRKDGAIIDLEMHGSVLEVDGKRLLISVLLDVTDRVRAARELEALQEALREQSIHDSLTGLYNRYHLEDFLDRELTAAGRAGGSVSVVMMDVDHFKAVNDHYGHLAGDEVLRAFGDVMKQHVRGSDMCCRFGGEEFLLVLPGSSQDVAAQRAEGLRRALAATRVVYNGEPISVTASFGVATFPRDGATLDQLVAAADGALYTAKATGRDRVCIGKTTRSGDDLEPGRGHQTKAATP
ncbi:MULTISPECIES: GGDEF domain-containing protein [Alphaproteobacteria]|uniref:diguanylate cyclase n=2 Tax=Alphaproteobacteria TaxID=28211 RepID=A0A512HGZ6_9HYPH|nr:MULTISPECIES: diguanylate cyclase [Alphaproteobacteria]GEO84729.1 hypothetical protein RNA01_16610 [Ciceribacter naphthalenivorans]GLR20650.1 hypothetical protein GCM10007920_04340 [Ciceribacter naphthalenivorans]GLT03506.1 hypothetical protein GCM10007926_04340 [Sphingomonas psychrolutea]